MKQGIIVLTACIALGVLPGCASKGGGETGLAASEGGAIDYEAQLRELVAEDVDRERQNNGERSARLLYSKPFYYKEYWELPEEELVFSADFTQKESLSIPLTAEAEVEKIRFATRASRAKDEVRDDDNYLRSTGIEQVSYELRHGTWRRVGSLFLAERTEEMRDGDWVQVEDRKQVVVLDEDEAQGFWQRFMFWR